MAKQTFTTGQVLTAAQMTSLQQTAMGGGSATAKTASYVLTAADAGTTVIMNSGSATTITVNTALFAAGDTVFIVNQGAGVCTITAGTATVTTAGSLAMAQNETGQLYFLSASAAIFTEYTQATGSSGSMTEIASGTFSNNALSITSISGSYKSLVLRMNNIYANNQDIDFRFNSDTGNNYGWTQMAMNGTSVNRTNTTTSFQFTQPFIATGQGPNFVQLTIPDYANTNSWKSATAQWGGNATGTRDGAWSLCTYSSTSAITSIQTRTAVTSGSYTLFGVN